MDTKSFFGKKNINKIKQDFIDDSTGLILRDIEKYEEIKKIGFSSKCNVCETRLNKVVFKKHDIN